MCSLLVLLVLVSGCATTPVPISEAKLVPKDRLLAFQTSSAEKTAILTVVRDEGFIGGGCYLALYINRVLSGRLDVGEFGKFYVEPGEILLRVGGDPQGTGLCGLGTDDWTQRETFLKPGEMKSFRLSIDGGFELDIQRSDI